MFKHIKTDSKYCRECKGSCLRPTSVETQKVAMKRFGIIPNGCVESMAGRSHCPYKK